MTKGNLSTSTNEWAENEFGIVDFGDKGLSKRLLKIVNSLAESPECSINQACEDWHQSKAAYYNSSPPSFLSGKNPPTCASHNVSYIPFLSRSF